MVFVSHDRYFIDRIANRIWNIEDGDIATYLGNYTDMQRHRAARQDGHGTIAPPAAPVRLTAEPEPEPLAPAEASAQPRASTRQNERTLRDAQKRLNTTEREVGRLEARLNDVSDEMTRAGIDQDMDAVTRLGAEYARLEAQLEAAYAAWSGATAALDAIHSVAAQ